MIQISWFLWSGLALTGPPQIQEHDQYLTVLYSSYEKLCLTAMSVCFLVIVVIMTLNFVTNIHASVIPTSKVLMRHYVSEGASIRLKCPSVSPWMLCMWTSPAREKLCVLRMTGTKNFLSLCSSNNSTMGENNKKYHALVSLHSCDLAFKVEVIISFSSPGITLILQAGPEDHGVWSCVLTSDPDIGRGAGRTWADLGVVTRPQVTIGLEGIEVSQVSVVSDHKSVPKMRLKLNHNYTFTCQVQRSFPRPEHRWNVNHTFSNLVRQINLPLRVSNKEYLYNSKSEAR